MILMNSIDLIISVTIIFQAIHLIIQYLQIIIDDLRVIYQLLPKILVRIAVGNLKIIFFEILTSDFNCL